MNRQAIPISDQYFSQQGQQHQQPPGIGPQVFSPQMSQARMQQAGIMQSIHGLENNQDLHNVYLLKQKMEAANSAFGQQAISQRQVQPQQQHILNNTGNTNGNSISAVNSLPQRAPGLTPVPGTLPRHIMPGSFALPPPNHFMMRDVWNNNLNSEFATIRKLIDQYSFVSISTEFVGTIARPIGNFRSKNDYHYQTMRANVDLLNPVQIGISLSDSQGNKPDNVPSTWQFNFHFDVTKEMVSAESLELLKKSGINFEKHQNIGIDPFDFAQLMIDSGLLLSKEITWLSYHAAYDFGFLVNMLMSKAMPNNKEEYVWWVENFMPNFYDLNLINKFTASTKQHNPQQQAQYSLESMADELGIPRFPLFTTTGGQSLLALLTFTFLAKLPLHNIQPGFELTDYKNMIYGITNE